MRTVGIIGAGNLGTHLYKLFQRNGLDHSVTLSNCGRNNKDIIESSDIIFLTVKPNNIQNVCEEIKVNNKWNSQKIIISAAAGVPISKITEWLGNNTLYNVVRCMPNLPISVGHGSIVWYFNSSSRVQEYINSMIDGPEMIYIQNEELMDAATVAFGCLPAYISKFFQTYLETGQEMGFTYEETHSLLIKTFVGTSILLKDYHPEEVIKQVASKGGATEKGLEMLDNSRFTENIKMSAFESLIRVQNITKSLD